jgi:hypothetical protein
MITAVKYWFPVLFRVVLEYLFLLEFQYENKKKQLNDFNIIVTLLFISVVLIKEATEPMVPPV